MVTVSARDPEGETVTYSIISGNNQGHFSIGESTGVVRVMQELDREETNRYSLVSQVRDGKLIEAPRRNNKRAAMIVRQCGKFPGQNEIGCVSRHGTWY